MRELQQVMRLRPGSILTVRFKVDGVDFSGEDTWVDLESTDGTSSQGRRSDPEGARFPSLEPGEYQVSVRDIPGYEPIPDQKVVVGAGKNEVVIALERSR